MFQRAVLIALCFSFLSACGGKNDDEDEDKRPIEYCHDLCERAVDCPDVPSGSLQDCKESCADAISASKEGGCVDEFEGAMKCVDRTFTCDSTGAECESEYEDYATCLLSDDGAEE